MHSAAKLSAYGAALAMLVAAGWAAGYDQWVQLSTAYLREHGLEPDTAHELALVALSALEGALLVSCVRRSTAPLRQVVDRIADLIDTEIAHA
jgi:hypothetical protein